MVDLLDQTAVIAAGLWHNNRLGDEDADAVIDIVGGVWGVGHRLGEDLGRAAAELAAGLQQLPPQHDADSAAALARRSLLLRRRRLPYFPTCLIFMSTSDVLLLLIHFFMLLSSFPHFFLSFLQKHFDVMSNSARADSVLVYGCVYSATVSRSRSLLAYGWEKGRTEPESLGKTAITIEGKRPENERHRTHV